MPHSQQISAAERRQFSEVLNRLQLVGQRASSDLVIGRSPQIPENVFLDNPLAQAEQARELSCWARHLDALHSLACAFHLLDHPQPTYIESLKDLSPEERIVAEVVDEVAVYATAYYICSRADLLPQLAQKFRDASTQLADQYRIPNPFSVSVANA